MAISRYLGKDTPPGSNLTKTDRNAPEASENSLGAESVRDGRPSTALPAFVSFHLLCYRWFQQINR